jgi:hypothetical protein
MTPVPEQRRKGLAIRATREALAARGRTFASLGPAGQAVLARELDVPLPELRAGLSGRASSSVSLAAEREQELEELRNRGSRLETDWADPIVNDARVWREVETLESRLRIEPKGSRAQRYLRLEGEMAFIHKLGLTDPDAVPDSVFHAARGTALRDAERAYLDRMQRSSRAHLLVARQTAAAKTARRLP